MDLRVYKTKRLIIDAFLQIRGQKSLEKITVKEVAELAEINKSTFYTHYKDIYDLSEQLENELVDTMVKNIPHAESIIEMPYEVTKELFFAYSARSEMFNIIFADKRKEKFINMLEKTVKKMIFLKHPELEENLKINVLVSLCIQGFSHAYISNSGTEYDSSLTELLAEISTLLANKLLND